jgi:hypothetical protein
MFYALGGTETLVKRIFSSWSWHEIYKNIDRYQWPKEQKNTRCTKPAQAQIKNKKQNIISSNYSEVDP